MRNCDDLCLELSKYQGSLFELSFSYLKCSSKYFLKKFMHSNLAKRLDRPGFIFESLDIKTALDELKNETDLSKGYVKISPQILYWIGYLYRYWSYRYEVSSKFLFQSIQLDELVNLYDAYHSLDVEEAINRINESKKISYFSSLEDQLEILRKLNK